MPIVYSTPLVPIQLRRVKTTQVITTPTMTLFKNMENRTIMGQLMHHNKFTSYVPARIQHINFTFIPAFLSLM